MSLYLDASVLLPILIEEPASARVDAFMVQQSSAPYVSEFAAAEVASALSRLVRTGVMEAKDAEARLFDFDVWRTSDTTPIELEASDVRLAATIVRRFELMLRTPDALHVAICRRLGAPLITLDKRLAIATQAMGWDVQLL